MALGKVVGLIFNPPMVTLKVDVPEDGDGLPYQGSTSLLGAQGNLKPAVQVVAELVAACVRARDLSLAMVALQEEIGQALQV